MVAKITLFPFWSSISIARASLSVMTFKCSFFHSWLTMMPFFTKMATPPLVPTSLSFLQSEARAQPPNLMNLSEVENFRSASLSSHDYVRHKNLSLLIITYLLLLARLKHMCWATGRPSPWSSANINVVYFVLPVAQVWAVRYVDNKNRLCLWESC